MKAQLPMLQNPGHEEVRTAVGLDDHHAGRSRRSDQLWFAQEEADRQRHYDPEHPDSCQECYTGLINRPGPASKSASPVPAVFSR